MPHLTRNTVTRTRAICTRHDLRAADRRRHACIPRGSDPTRNWRRISERAGLTRGDLGLRLDSTGDAAVAGHGRELTRR
jgi:hypothetical protein